MTYARPSIYPSTATARKSVVIKMKCFLRENGRIDCSLLHAREFGGGLSACLASGHRRRGLTTLLLKGWQ